MKIVEITWEDASYQDEIVSEEELNRPLLLKSCGYLIGQSDERIAICQDESSPVESKCPYRRVLTIPMAIVQDIQIVRDDDSIEEHLRHRMEPKKKGRGKK